MRFPGIFCSRGVRHLAEVSRNLFCIFRNKVFLHSCRPLGLHAKIKQFFLCVLDIFPCFLGRWGRFRVALRRRCLPARSRRRQERAHHHDTKNRQPFCPHAPAFLFLVTTSFNTANARSHPARSTSQ